MDENFFPHYIQKAKKIRSRRKYPSIKTLEDLKAFLKIEQEVEQFHFEVEHSGGPEDWRILLLLDFVGRPMISASLMLTLLNQIENQNKRK